ITLLVHTLFVLFFLRLLRPPRSPLFPYTTLFRSVDYVGSPVLDAVRAHQADESFLERENLLDERPLVALLPGSRRHEVELIVPRSEEHTSELQSRENLVCRLLLEKKKMKAK